MIDHQQMVELARDYARQEPFLRFASMLSPMKVKGLSKIRVGSTTDGGYVMLDDFAGNDLALSFGVDINADWDLEVVNRGIRVQQYDHSVPSAPILHPDIDFFKKMIVAEGSGPDSTSIHDILAEAGIARDASVILKIDIEAHEWPVLLACSDEDLCRFSQILIEFHNIDQAVDHYWMRTATHVIGKLHKLFQPYHVHANNWSPMAAIGNVFFPSTLEVSYANRSRYGFEETDELFPTKLDRPNNPLRPDIYLGSFKFRPLSQM